MLSSNEPSSEATPTAKPEERPLIMRAFNNLQTDVDLNRNRKISSRQIVRLLLRTAWHLASISIVTVIFGCAFSFIALPTLKGTGIRNNDDQFMAWVITLIMALIVVFIVKQVFGTIRDIVFRQAKLVRGTVTMQEVRRYRNRVYVGSIHYVKVADYRFQLLDPGVHAAIVNQGYYDVYFAPGTRRILSMELSKR